MLVNPIELLVNHLTISMCHICKGEADMLCQTCKEKTFPELESRCYKCNKITSQNRVCTSCSSSSRIRRVWWLSPYSGVTKDLIRQTKFSRKRIYARKLGEILDDSLPFLPEETIIAAVPTASARVRRRGFDHAKLLAQTFAEHRNLAFKNILSRTSQVDQIGKRRIERIKQMQGSIQVKNNIDIKGKTILLVDDVITTGATIETAATVLRSQGASHVDVAVISRHLLG